MAAIAYDDCTPGSRAEAIEQLGALVCATTAEALAVIVAADRAEDWRVDGATDMASWLVGTLHVSAATARAWVRVGRALEALPYLRAAFAAGELSWDQISAATQFATPELDEVLAAELPGFTATQIEDMARQRRVIRRVEAERTTNRRRFRWRASRDEAGFHYSGFLPAVEGAIVNAALERGAEGSPRDAETGTFPCAEHRYADALVELAQQKLVEDPGPDPTMVVVHADAEVVDGTTEGNASVGELQISSATLDRVLCDTAIEANVDGPDGTCIGVGRSRRTPPRWLRRRILRRDEGHCRFPGCGRRIRQVHHIHHWRSGGVTDSHNLVGLCWYHHHLVHEGGWGVTGNADGALTFAGPFGRTLTTRPPPLRRTTSRRIEGIIGLALGSAEEPDPPGDDP
jgi:hypothetical protein